jgi:Cell Wall Hydrolase
VIAGTRRFGALLTVVAAGAALVAQSAGAATRRDHASAAKTAKAAIPKPPAWTVVAAPPDASQAPGDADVHVLIGATPLEPSSHAAVIALGSPDGPSLGEGSFILLVGRGPAVLGRDALTCMTQAVYFEARSEPLEGQEAVAQVVMNRTHMAQYPSQVCDVVFQGAERATGCQFSFVCNGALGPPAESDAWRRAGVVAQRALAGFVYEPLKDATHFHATYVTPYWSGSLTRLKQIGGHIFYR